MNIYTFESTLMLVVLVVLLAIKGFAFINALTYSAEAYEAAGKLTKQAWCLITGLGFAANLILMGLAARASSTWSSPSPRSSTSPTYVPRWPR